MPFAERSTSVLETQTLPAALAVAAGEDVDDARLAAIWAALEGGLPRLGTGSAAAAAAEMLCHLIQGRLGPRLPKGPGYVRRLEPLAAELHAMLGSAAAGDRAAQWWSFADRCARVYTDADEPLRHRLLALQWARMACGRAFAEGGRVLVPPTLDGVPAAPFWYAGA